MSALELFEQYLILVDDYRDRVASAVLAIADAPAGCVVVSCHAGRDRTGVVVALTLELVGVPLELIASDYADSVASSDTILRLLAHVRSRYGGTAAYLLEAGATTEQLDALMGRLTG